MPCVVATISSWSPQYNVSCAVRTSVARPGVTAGVQTSFVSFRRGARYLYMYMYIVTNALVWKLKDLGR